MHKYIIQRVYATCNVPSSTQSKTSILYSVQKDITKVHNVVSKYAYVCMMYVCMYTKGIYNIIFICS